jgi:hypothetical protein
MSMARSTRSGTGLGPGICKKWRPWCWLMDFLHPIVTDILHSIHTAATNKLFTLFGRRRYAQAHEALDSQ